MKRNLPLLALARAVAIAAMLLLVLLPTARAADLIETVSAEIVPDGDGWSLSADFKVPLPGRLEEMVGLGIALHFTTELEVSRRRWYWWDEKIVQAGRTSRLSYHALTRQYRLSTDGLQQSFATFGEAVQAMSVVRGWRVLDAAAVTPGTGYEAYVRMRLDTSQLPKPFQVTAITNRDWNVQAEWKRFIFTPETAKTAQ